METTHFDKLSWKFCCEGQQAHGTITGMGVSLREGIRLKWRRVEHDCMLMGITTRARGYEDQENESSLARVTFLKGENEDSIDWMCWFC